jgi:hypothetical protein
MKFGIRKPSFKKSIAARTSIKRMVKNSLGLRAPKGYGWLTHPKKAAYNRVYGTSRVSTTEATKTAQATRPFAKPSNRSSAW